MKFKLHWGNSIFIFYGTFVVVLIGFLIFTTFHKVDLVDNNYYDKELKYESQIEKMNRTLALPEKLSVNTDGKAMEIKYPGNFDHSTISGRIHFFRPSNEKLDFTINVSADSANTQLINVTKAKRGLWRLKIDWQAGENTYYNEETVVLN